MVWVLLVGLRWVRVGVRVPLAVGVMMCMSECAVVQVVVCVIWVVLTLRRAARHALVVRPACAAVELDDWVLVVLRTVRIPPSRLSLVPKWISFYPLAFLLRKPSVRVRNGRVFMLVRVGLDIFLVIQWRTGRAALRSHFFARHGRTE